MTQTQTVVALFENENDAQTAVKKLAGTGITGDNIDVSMGTKESYEAASGEDTDNAFTSFFKNLFGDDNDDADRYAAVSGRGYTIVTVHASSGDQAEEAADILDDFGAVDVNEKAVEYGVYNTDKESIAEERDAIRRRSRIVESR